MRAVFKLFYELFVNFTEYEVRFGDLFAIESEGENLRKKPTADTAD